MDRYLRTQDKNICDGKSLIVMNVVVAPKLHARKLRLNKLILRGATVGGVRTPKVLKNVI